MTTTTTSNTKTEPATDAANHRLVPLAGVLGLAGVVLVHELAEVEIIANGIHPARHGTALRAVGSSTDPRIPLRRSSRFTVSSGKRPSHSCRTRGGIVSVGQIMISKSWLRISTWSTTRPSWMVA
ncbi:hypothetical protein E3O53_14700 [Cryobacterium sp. TMT2-18-3]|nr:hypothetical protein E3O22_15390 [Cryobacterium sp. TMT2-18-2]TFC39609.1 hypothetical protein E3O18_01800 [Cryobacterium sp. TMT2-42-4]TFC61264.1 hypothetical protein E3O53_14700 [Cryobacterium sp. TMT2-18-3]